MANFAYCRNNYICIIIIFRFIWCTSILRCINIGSVFTFLGIFFFWFLWTHFCHFWSLFTNLVVWTFFIFDRIICLSSTFIYLVSGPFLINSNFFIWILCFSWWLVTDVLINSWLFKVYMANFAFCRNSYIFFRIIYFPWIYFTRTLRCFHCKTKCLFLE